MVLIKSTIPDQELNNVWYSWKLGTGYVMNPTLTYKKNKRRPSKNYFKAGVGVITLNPQAVSGVIEGLQGKGYDRLFKSTSQMSNLEIGIGLSSVALFAVSGSIGSRLGRGKANFPSLKEIKQHPKFKKYFPKIDRSIDAQYLTTKYRFENQTPQQRVNYQNKLMDYEKNRLDALVRYNRETGNKQGLKTSQEQLDNFVDKEYSQFKEQLRKEQRIRDEQIETQKEEVREQRLKELGNIYSDLEWVELFKLKYNRNPLEGELYSFKYSSLKKNEFNIIDEWYKTYSENQEGVDVNIQELGRRVMSLLDSGDGNINEPPIFGRWANENLTPQESTIIQNAYNNPKIWELMKRNYKTSIGTIGTIGGIGMTIEKPKPSTPEQPEQPEQPINENVIEQIIEEEGEKDESLDLVEDVKQTEETKTQDQVIDTSFGNKEGVLHSLKDEAPPLDIASLITNKEYDEVINEYKYNIQHTHQFNNNINASEILTHKPIDKNLLLEYIEENHLVYNTGEEETSDIKYVGESTNYYQIRVRVNKKGNRTIVSFRGTDNYGNMKADVNSRMWDDSKLSDYFNFINEENDLKLHTGFIESVKDVYENVKVLLEGRDNIEYTGHSLGSIVCVFSYVYFIETGKKPKDVITFGSPRIFINDPNYPIERFNDNIELIRVFNFYDGISYIPIKDSKTTGAGIFGLIGGYVGYSLGGLIGGMFQKKLFNTYSKIGAGVGGGIGSLVGRQLGNFIHVGTGVMLYDYHGSYVRSEYSFHESHKAGRLPPDVSYVIIPKGLDSYRNPIDVQSNIFTTLTTAIGSLFGSEFLLDHYNRNTPRGPKHNLFVDIEKQINRLSEKTLFNELKQYLVDPKNLESSGPNMETMKRFFNTYGKNTIRQIARKRIRNYNKELSRIQFKRFGKGRDATFLQEEEIIKQMTIDINLLKEGNIPREYYEALQQNGLLRELWIKIQRNILLGDYSSSQTYGPKQNIFNTYENLLTISTSVMMTIAVLIKGMSKEHKFIQGHYLSTYEKNIKLLPQLIIEHKENKNIIETQEDVFINTKTYDPSSKTDQTQNNQESQEPIQGEGQTQNDDEEKTSQETQEIEADKYFDELLQEIEIEQQQYNYDEKYKGSKLFHKHTPHNHIQVHRNKLFNIADNLGFERLEKLLEKRKQKKELMDEIKTSVKQKNTITLQHLKNGFYETIDNKGDNNLYKMYLLNNTIKFKPLNLKILGYYPYRNTDEIENKLVIF